jgi:hypothetical protein
MSYQGDKTVQSLTITSGATAGADGSASDRTTTGYVVNGKIVAIYVTYDASATASTDVNIGDSTGADSQTILSLTNASDSGWFYPRIFQEDTAGTDLIYSTDNEVPDYAYVNDKLTMTVTGTNSDQTFTARILYQ